MNLDRRTALAALAAAGLLWGTTVPVTKLALQWLPPGWLTVARFGLAAAVLLAAVGFRVRGAASPAVLAWGAVGYGGSILVQNAGITRTSVSHAALLIGATPVLVAVIAALRHRSVAPPVAWTGFAVSFAGVGLVAAGAGPVLATAGLVLFGTLAAATLFAYGQARVSAEIAGSFVNLEPLVGAAAGAAVFGDPLGIAQAAGAAAILTGIALGSLPLLRAGPRSPGQASIAVLAETPCDQLPPQAVARLRDRVYAALHQGSVRHWVARSPWARRAVPFSACGGG
jgi:drug/metabolite transporter (DMT)-like permease